MVVLLQPVDENALEKRVGEAVVGPLAEDPLQAEVVGVDALSVPLLQTHELGARPVGEVRPSEYPEECGADFRPLQRRPAGLHREVVPQGGVAVEGDGEDANEGADVGGVVGAADAVESREVGDGALRGLAAEDGQRSHVDVGGGRLGTGGAREGVGVELGAGGGAVFAFVLVGSIVRSCGVTKGGGVFSGVTGGGR